MVAHDGANDNDLLGNYHKKLQLLCLLRIAKKEGKKGRVLNMTSIILKRQLAAKKNKKKGFTLIELIVVIVIIAIIAAIAVPALTRYIESANNRAAQAIAHNIQVVLQAEVTEFYEYKISTVATSGADATDPLFDTTNAPKYFPDGSDFPNVIGEILEFNGINISQGDLTDIVFIGKKLDAFRYEHDNGAVVVYSSGTYEFNPQTP